MRFFRLFAVAFVVLFALASVSIPASPARYTVRFLDPPLGMDSASVIAMNDSGQMLGYAKDALRWSHALVWERDGSVRDIGFLGKANDMQVYSINDLGQVVGNAIGWYLPAPVEIRAFVWDPNTGFTDLGLNNRAFGINDSGIVVGDYGSPVHPCMWTTDRMRMDLGSLGGFYGSANDINDSGQITGSSNTANRAEHACIWEPDGSMRDLGALPGYPHSRGLYINNAGQVVGFSYIAYPYVPTLWNSDGTKVKLSYSDWPEMWASDINDSGVVVGAAADSNHKVHGWVYDSEAGVKEFTMPGLLGLAPRCINNQGIVAGTALDTVANKVRTVIIVPIIDVSIDIKPDDLENRINLRSKGVVPVAVLTTPDFDAAEIDTASLSLAGAAPEKWHVEDVDLDGDMDLLLHFRVQDLQLTTGITEAVLSGMTMDGDPVEGKDSVSMVKATK